MNRKETIEQINVFVNQGVKVKDIYGKKWSGYLVRTWVRGSYEILLFNKHDTRIMLDWNEIDTIWFLNGKEVYKNEKK